MSSVDVFLVLAPLFHTKLPPLSLAYLAESLERAGRTIRCFDLNIQLFNALETYRSEWNIQYNISLQRRLCDNELCSQNPIINSFLCEIGAQKPKIISFSLYKNNLYPTFHLARLIKERYPEIPIIFGGPEVGALMVRNESMPADYWVCGEGEAALVDFVARVDDNTIPLAGQISRPQKEEVLSAIPFPSFSQLKLTEYECTTALPILMSRGCVRKCAFCSERLLYNGYRMRSAANVVGEIRQHKLAYGIARFVFYDSLINGDLSVLEELCDMLIAEQLHISWEAQCIVRNDMSDILIQKMKEAGCYNLFIGLESGSDTVLKRMNKGFSVVDAARFFEQLTKQRLHFEISLITNFLEETEAEFCETQNFLRTNAARIPKIAQLNPFIPYEGTDSAKHEQGAWVWEAGEKKMKRMIETFEECGIPYTKSYIGNLLPK